VSAALSGTARAAAVLACVALVAACGGRPAVDTAAPPLVPAPGPPQTNTADVCDGAIGATQDLVRALLAAGFTEREPTGRAQAQRELMSDYAREMRAFAVRASDPPLRSALELAATGADEAAATPHDEELDPTTWTRAGTELNRLCGRGGPDPSPGPPAG
jgi:hypothetical protein